MDTRSESPELVHLAGDLSHMDFDVLSRDGAPPDPRLLGTVNDAPFSRSEWPPGTVKLTGWRPVSGGYLLEFSYRRGGWPFLESADLSPYGPPKDGD
jgi:hypothetical protein